MHSTILQLVKLYIACQRIRYFSPVFTRNYNWPLSQTNVVSLLQFQVISYNKIINKN